MRNLQVGDVWSVIGNKHIRIVSLNPWDYRWFYDGRTNPEIEIGGLSLEYMTNHLKEHGTFLRNESKGNAFNTLYSKLLS